MRVPLESITSMDYLVSKGYVIEVDADDGYANIYKPQEVVNEAVTSEAVS